MHAPKFLLCCFLSAFSGAAVGMLTDIDGDGIDDLGIYHWESGNWYGVGSTIGGVAWNWGGPTRQPVLGDFDGDGKLDPAVYDAATAEWIMYQTATDTVWSEMFGEAGRIPVVADYDGDGKTDLALYEWETSRWSIQFSETGLVQEEIFGWPEARPVPADYDGDGRTDLAVYHRHTGTWFIFGSTSGFRSLQFGFDQARAVPGDYDGDGADDIAVYHAASGNWHIFGSTTGYRIFNWGFASARPIPADYDGDGMTDPAVWDRATSTWFIYKSATRTSDSFVYGWEMATPLQSYQSGGIEGGVVLCFGDSITFGVGSSDPETESYPSRLARELGPAFGGMFQVINAGNPGETTSRGIDRFMELVSRHRPEWTLVMEGTNDHFFARTYNSIQNNILEMVFFARDWSSSILVANSPPVINSSGVNRIEQAARIRGFLPVISSLLDAVHVPLVDVYGAVTSVSGWETTLMDRASGNHPDEEGYEVLAETFMNAIRQGLMDGALY